MDYSWSPRHSRFLATPFAGIISGLGIICLPTWGSFVVLGTFAGRDHLRGRTDHPLSPSSPRVLVLQFISASVCVLGREKEVYLFGPSKNLFLLRYLISLPRSRF